jgi:hypothetical protein
MAFCLVSKSCISWVIAWYALHGFSAVLEPVTMLGYYLGYILLSFAAKAEGFITVV